MFTFCIFGKFWNTLKWLIVMVIPRICELAALGPKAVQRPKPVKARSNARIVTAMETAGSGADDKVCINFTKFLNN